MTAYYNLLGLLSKYGNDLTTHLRFSQVSCIGRAHQSNAHGACSPRHCTGIVHSSFVPGARCMPSSLYFVSCALRAIPETLMSILATSISVSSSQVNSFVSCKPLLTLARITSPPPNARSPCPPPYYLRIAKPSERTVDRRERSGIGVHFACICRMDLGLLLIV
jgi:hypothetical protein